MPAPPARLDVHDDLGHRFVDIRPCPFTIGRGVGHHLQIAGTGVANDEAVITQTADGYLLQSVNAAGSGAPQPTLSVNGIAVTRHLLLDGDRIAFGSTKGVALTFVSRPEAPSPGAAPASPLRQVSALLHMLGETGSSHVIDELLTLALDAAIQATGAERGLLALADERGVLEPRLARHAGGVTVPVIGFATRKIPEDVFLSGETRLVSDAGAGQPGSIAPGNRHALCTPLQLGRADASLPRRNVGVIYVDSANPAFVLAPGATAALQTLATEAAAAIEYARLFRATLEKARSDQEMQVAARIQQALLPEPRRSGAFFEAVGASTPSRAIGGDFFDYQVLPDGSFGFALGDVTGKGPAAALMTSMVQGALAVLANTSREPGALLLEVNRLLLSRRTESRYVTMFLGTLAADGLLTYSNAGQNPPFLLTAAGVRRLSIGGTLLGAFPQSRYDQATVQLAAGDTLVLFSDGVTDAISAEGVVFGDDRLEAVIDVESGGPIDEVLRALFDAVADFAHDAAQQDDLTAVIVRYLGADAGQSGHAR